jgi:hypothetical protein
LDSELEGEEMRGLSIPGFLGGGQPLGNTPHVQGKI